VDFVTMAKGAGYRMALAIADLAEFSRRFPELLNAEGPVMVELITGLSEQTPMTAGGGVPFHQQVHDLRVKLLHPHS
jgi:hypothetical protein